LLNTTQDRQLREQMARSFEREAETLVWLNHPAIPQVFDYFTVSDRSYLVQEYIQGSDLEAILNGTESFFPHDQVRRWGIEICDVLTYLHSHEPDPIVFRGIQPSNVMIDHLERVRLVGFSRAKMFQAGKQSTIMVTEGYSPPEQYIGVATPLVEIYALGAPLHHLLTRSDPQYEPPFTAILRSIKDYNPDVPDALAAVVMKALNYNPDDRYVSAREMKQALIEVG
jgi:serine/threonine protein kinase